MEKRNSTDSIKASTFSGARSSAQEDKQSDTGRIAFDLEKYRPFLEDDGLCDAQKEELLAALWNIMTAFVELGFGLHPVQQVGCGKLQPSSPEKPSALTDLIDCEVADYVRHFEDTAAPCVDDGEEGRPK